MTVYLVGAGPGEPELITVRGANLLRHAEVVIYDRLVSPGLLDLAPKQAIRIAVGKAPGGPSTRQKDINSLLIEYGRQHHYVIRLKGGDPFVFGRGGEEITALADADVAFEVVPGVTSALAAPAAAGIPVTHRGISSAFIVVSGHDLSGRNDPPGGLDWDALGTLGATIVVLMGVSGRGDIARRLLGAGMVPETPVAAIENSTLHNERVTRGCLYQLEDMPIGAPAVIVIGNTAEALKILNKPRHGKR